MSLDLAANRYCTKSKDEHFSHEPMSRQHCYVLASDYLALAAQIEALNIEIDRLRGLLKKWVSPLEQSFVKTNLETVTASEQRQYKRAEQLERDLAAAREAWAKIEKAIGEPCHADLAVLNIVSLKQQLAEAQARVKPE